MRMLELLNDLKAHPKATDKKRILKENDSKVLYRVTTLALNPRIVFDRKNVHIPEDCLHDGSMTLFDALTHLTLSPSLSGKEGKARVEKMLNCLTEDDATVLQMVINKDLKCGIGAKTVNAALGYDIPVFEVMKAEKEKEHPLDKLNYPAYLQTKVDASRVYACYEQGETYLYTSSGNRLRAFVQVHDALGHIAEQTGLQSFFIDGEVIYEDSDEKYTRGKSNGKMNSYISGKLPPEKEQFFRFIIWDIVEDVSSIFEGNDQPYFERFELLEKLELRPCLELVESCVVDDADHARFLSQQLIDQGEEGTVVKEMNSPFEAKRSKHWVKVKKAYMADVRVVGLNEGKNEGTLGSLQWETDDGKLSGSVTGISDKKKELWWDDPELIVGKVIQIRYMEISKDKRTGKESLYLPSFMWERPDKETTNSYEDLK